MSATNITININLTCADCGRVCGSKGGLTQHFNSAHRAPVMHPVPKHFRRVDTYINYAVNRKGQVINLAKHNKVMAQTPNNSGYMRVGLCKRGSRQHKLVHRLVALAFIEEVEGSPQVDHRDGDPLNNHVSNLRFCTRSQNGANTRARSDSKLGVKGVGLDKRSGKYRTAITIDGKRIHLGYFDTAKEAKDAYDAASIAKNGEFHRS